MRLDNGAINDAGQGHNRPTLGLDRSRCVCIPLRQNGIRGSRVAAEHYTGPVHTDHPANYYAAYYYSPSWSEPVDMEDNP